MSEVKKCSVAAVVVTYNRKNLLRECLQALLAQTRPLDEIIVIDNASTDGTDQMVPNEFPQVTYVRLPENIGGAGGFHEGMRLAHKKGFDWIWLMDDDGLPMPLALFELISKAERHGLEIVGPLVCDTEDDAKLAFGLSGGITTVEDARRSANDGIIMGTLNPFNGTLIARHVLEKIGYVKKEMFIWGDEVEYLLRAKANNIRLGSVVSAIHKHPRMQGKREKVALGLLGEIVVKPPDKAHIYYRNLGYINSKYGRAIDHWKTITKYTVHFVTNKGFKIMRLWEFYRYYIDGMMDRYTLPPAREASRESSSK